MLRRSVETTAKTGSNQLDHFVPNRGLVERDAYTFFLAPNDMASPLELIARDKEREAVGDKQRGHDFERSPCLGQVANDAVNSTAAELNCSGLQHAATWRYPVFVHGLLHVRLLQTVCLQPKSAESRKGYFFVNPFSASSR